MKRNVTFTDFERAFVDFGRDKSWSIDGLAMVYDEITDFEADTGEEVELDVIAIDCEFCEYKTLKDALEDYDIDYLDSEGDFESTEVDCFVDDHVIQHWQIDGTDTITELEDLESIGPVVVRSH